MSSSEVGAPTAGRSNYFNSNAGLEPAWSRLGAVLEPCWGRLCQITESPPTPSHSPHPSPKTHPQ